MKNFRNYTKGILSLLAVFFISNSSFAAITDSNQSGGLSNTSVFYILIALAIILLVGIFFLSNSVKDLMKSEFYKEKIYEQEQKKRKSKEVITTLLLLIGIPFASMSMSTSASVAENSDIPLSWVWAMVVINLILLGVVFYIRNVFYELLRSVKAKKVAAKSNQEASILEPKKIASILTDVVPLDREHEILMDHEYDGIHELDNNLPPWWLWSFYASIVFAFLYLLNYHVLGTGDLQMAEFKKENDIADIQIAEYLKSQKLNVDENSVIYLTEASAISKGKSIFDNNCVACHGAKGEGVIGPNLTDDNWIHGGSIKDIFKLIKYGAPSKGMQAWNKDLNAVEIQQVSSFIKSIKGTAVGIGKEPQGDIYKDEVAAK